MRLIEASCAAMILWGTAVPAAAWDSDAHTAITQMTRNIWAIPGMANSFRYWVTSDNAGASCYSSSSAVSVRESIADGVQRLYLELVCASDEPDRDRNPFKSDLPFGESVQALIANHKRNPTPYALQEFNDAVGWYRQGYLLAAIHALGRSLHYVADLTDFTVDLGSSGGGFRQATRQRAQQLLLYCAQSAAAGYPPDLGQELDRMWAQFQADHNSPQTPEEFLNGALEIRAETARAFTEFMNSAEDEGTRNSQFAQAVDIAVKGTIMVQEYWIALFLQRVRPAGAPGGG
jgi:hypothetical protein